MSAARDKKPEINTSEFKTLHPFEQIKAVEGTPHAIGLCNSFSSLFVRKMRKNQSIAAFEQQKYKELYKEAVQEEDRFIAAERDGEDGDNVAFDDAKPEVAVVEPKKVVDTLTNAQSALLKYRTSSGAYHRLAFYQDLGKCHIHDPNRFTGTADCDLAAKTLRDIILRSNPDIVKITYTRKVNVL